VREVVSGLLGQALADSLHAMRKRLGVVDWCAQGFAYGWIEDHVLADRFGRRTTGAPGT
jgi:hypothetical protein